MKKTLLYAGSFDMPTLGHEWVILEGNKLPFEKFIVAVGINADKKYTFTIEERLNMVRGISPSNVDVISFDNEYLVNFAMRMGATHLLRGIRDSKDYTFERGMRYINEDVAKATAEKFKIFWDNLAEAIPSTLFVIPPKEFIDISSSMIKGLIGIPGWEDVIKKYLPDSVYKAVVEKYKGK